MAWQDDQMEKLKDRVKYLVDEAGELIEEVMEYSKEIDRLEEENAKLRVKIDDLEIVERVALTDRYQEALQEGEKLKQQQSNYGQQMFNWEVVLKEQHGSRLTQTFFTNSPVTAMNQFLNFYRKDHNQGQYVVPGEKVDYIFINKQGGIDW